jgi:glycosyltransferase involved in cell wall biosynthesis
MAKVCLNMIVKNEKAIIKRCLEASSPHIDCYAICDTGSTDGTAELIEQFFHERGVPGVIVRTVFRNFEQARNEALEMAHATALDFDYFLLCDADMELVVHRPGYRRELMADAYLVRWRAATSVREHDQIRLVKRQLKCRYKGVTHEYLDTAVPGLRFDGISFIDHESGSNRQGKYKRDLELLLQGLNEEPNNARYVFYLGNSYFDMGDFTNAIAAHRRRVGMGGWEEEIFYSLYCIGLALGLLGREPEMIQQHLDTFDSYPLRAEPLHALALHYQRSGKHRLAYHVAEIGRNITTPKSALLLETDIYAWRLADIVSVSLYYMGRFKESVELCDRLLQIVPISERPRIVENRKLSIIRLEKNGV